MRVGEYLTLFSDMEFGPYSMKPLLKEQDGNFPLKNQTIPVFLSFYYHSNILTYILDQSVSLRTFLMFLVS